MKKNNNLKIEPQEQKVEQKQEQRESFFSLDKVEHLLLFLWLGFCLSAVWNIFTVLVICAGIGLAIEIVETLPVWGRIMAWMGEKEGTAPISWKDLVVDVVGTVAGIIAWLCR